MVGTDRRHLAMLGAAGLLLSGCVAAGPAATLTVIPGQGKTEADLRRDDAYCRQAPVATTAGTVATTGAADAAGVSEEQYYGCMQSRGEAVVQQAPQPAAAYAYAPAVYPAYPYGYGYPYPYPYYGAYYGPYVGFGLGFGYGRFWGGGPWHGGGWGGGWHGGGGWHR